MKTKKNYVYPAGTQLKPSKESNEILSGAVFFDIKLN